MKLAKRFLIAALILIIAAMLIVLPACSIKQKPYEQMVHEFYEDRKDKLPDWVTEEYCMEFYRSLYSNSNDPPSSILGERRLSPQEYGALCDEWVDYNKDYYEDESRELE